jgi:hypothetical protein
MKKLILLVLIFCVSQVSAQQHDNNVLLSTKGKVILPEAGDYAIGLAVNPLMKFVGNMFNDQADNHFYIRSIQGASVYGKYFFSPQTALRAKIYVDYRDNKQFNRATRFYHSNLIFGLEKRGGVSRWQFLYGPEIILEARGDSDKIIFSNSVNNKVEERLNSLYNMFSVGARGFAGVEYFILPKLSLAAEMGLSVKGSVWGESSTRSPVTDEIIELKDKSFKISTDHLDGQLMLMLHF